VSTAIEQTRAEGEIADAHAIPRLFLVLASVLATVLATGTVAGARKGGTVGGLLGAVAGGTVTAVTVMYVARGDGLSKTRAVVAFGALALLGVGALVATR